MVCTIAYMCIIGVVACVLEVPLVIVYDYLLEVLLGWDVAAPGRPVLYTHVYSSRYTHRYTYMSRVIIYIIQQYT